MKIEEYSSSALLRIVQGNLGVDKVEPIDRPALDHGLQPPVCSQGFLFEPLHFAVGPLRILLVPIPLGAWIHLRLVQEVNGQTRMLFAESSPLACQKLRPDSLVHLGYLIRREERVYHDLDPGEAAEGGACERHHISWNLRCESREHEAYGLCPLPAISLGQRLRKLVQRSDWAIGSRWNALDPTSAVARIFQKSNWCQDLKTTDFRQRRTEGVVALRIELRSYAQWQSNDHRMPVRVLLGMAENPGLDLFNFDSSEEFMGLFGLG